MNAAPLRIGTRKSALARWQADWVASELQKSGAEVEMVYITTKGDVTSGPLDQAGGQGLFTKAIQQALLEDRIDLAVHSLKDLPTEKVEGLTLGATPLRQEPGDALVAREPITLQDLPAGALVGTGSLRRRAQLLHLRPDLEIQDIRGNLDTRLRKLDESEYDAILLAVAGLNRLGWASRITQALPPSVMLPAAGQGSLGIETRADDQRVLGHVAGLNHAETNAAVTAERSLLANLRAGCLAPVGAWGRVEDQRLLLDAVVLSADGKQRLVVHHEDALENAYAAGQKAAEELLQQGAEQLITSARGNRTD